MNTPAFSYVRLPNGKSTVTCTCGWRDPLGPVAPSPFDPAEALAAAHAEHPRCIANGRVEPLVFEMTVDKPFEIEQFMPDPKKITEQTTLGELAIQRAMLSITGLQIFADLGGGVRGAIAHHATEAHIGRGRTEAIAIDDAFASVRRSMLPEPLKALLDEPVHEPVLDRGPQCEAKGQCEDLDGSGTCKGCGRWLGDTPEAGGGLSGTHYDENKP